MEKPFKRGFVLTGVAILVFVFLLAVMNLKQNPKETIKKSYLNTHIVNPDIELEISGDLVPIDEDFFFYIKNDIKKIDKNKNIIWQKDLNGFNIIDDTEKFLLLSRDGTLKIVDDMGKEVFVKHDFLYNPKLESASDEVFLLTGEKNEQKFLTLIDRAGNIRFNRGVTSPVISANTDIEGNYTIISVLKDEISDEIVFLDSFGKTLWKKKSDIPFLMKIVNNNIIAVYGKKVCKLDFDGNVIWEKVLKNPVLKASIENNGYTALVVNDTISNFSRQVMPRLMILDSRGNQIFSCFLQREPYNIKLCDDKLLASYDDCIEIYLKGKDKYIVLNIRGNKDLKDVTSSYILVRQGNRSFIIKDPGRL